MNRIPQVTIYAKQAGVAITPYEKRAEGRPAERRIALRLFKLESGSTAIRFVAEPAEAFELYGKMHKVVRDGGKESLSHRFEGRDGEVQTRGQMNQMLGFDQAKTNMAGDMLNKAMGYMFQVPEAQGSAMDQWYQNIGALSSVGEQNRMMNQTEMDMRRQMAFEPYSDIVNYFLDPMIGLTTGQMGSATTQQVQQPSGLNQALGAGSQVAGLGAALKYLMGV